ncbi:GNAT family N-acetyltransferase [soil metagenome]
MLSLNFHPFPELHTERLVLRQLVKADAAGMQQLRSGEGLKYLPHLTEKSLEEHAAWINKINANVVQNEALQWAITLKEQPEQLLGTLCLWNIDTEAKRGEIGYHLAIALHRQGIMSEALIALIDLSKSIGLSTLEAFTLPYNEPSLLLLKKLGFVHDPAAEARVGTIELHGNVVYSLSLVD